MEEIRQKYEERKQEKKKIQDEMSKKKEEDILKVLVNKYINEIIIFRKLMKKQN